MGVAGRLSGTVSPFRAVRIEERTEDVLTGNEKAEWGHHQGLEWDLRLSCGAAYERAGAKGSEVLPISGSICCNKRGHGDSCP